MAGAGDRLSSWLDGKTVKASQNTKAEVRRLLNKYVSRSGTSLDLIDLVEWIKAHEDTPIGWFIGIVILAFQMIGVVLGGSEPVANEIKHAQYRIIRSSILDVNSSLTAWLRGGANKNEIPDDLKAAGFSDDKIRTLMGLTSIIPGVQDLVRMSVREAFTPEIAEKFGQYQDPPTAVYPWAEKIGLSKEWVDRYWAAHWDLPSTGNGFEMLHRGIITEDDLKMLLRALDVMPFWRDKLIKLSWNIPTRVDVRRFYDLRTIDEKRLREIYMGMGYHGRDLEDYILWTKIYVEFPDLLARFKNGWLSVEDMKARLVALGMKPVAVDELIQTKVKAAASERMAKDKDLTAAEIVKGVKKQVISYSEGLELLQELGYDEWEAEFKLAIDVAVETGSPESYAEFRDLTQKFRLATGREGKPMSEEIKKLGAEVVRLSAEVAALEKSIKDEQDKLVPDKAVPAAAKARVKELQATLYKAQAELARVRTSYNARIAEWKHAT